MEHSMQSAERRYMIVQSSAVGMNSRRHYYANSREETSSLVYWGTPKGTKDKGLLEDAMKEAGVSEEETAEVKNEITGTENQKEHAAKKTMYQIKREVVNYLLEVFFGKGQKEWNTDMINLSSGGFSQEFGGTYTKSSFFHEQETTTFHTKGSVVTADGRELSFNIDVEMTRSFTSYVEQHVQFGAERVCDPLVINLDTNIASVSDKKFLFDLDADGKEDTISMLSKGSGFLALDKNHNGKIDDGSELFGAKSGNGFAELEEYDIDKNGWIDEADEIFNKLKIWIKDEDGNDRLIGLKEAGVGAICLKNTDTQFSLNSRFGNRTNAYIRKTGIFLYENGGSGTIQHLDLVQ